MVGSGLKTFNNQYFSRVGFSPPTKRKTEAHQRDKSVKRHTMVFKFKFDLESGSILGGNSF